MMMYCCNCDCNCDWGFGVFKNRLQNWLRNYDTLQYLAVVLIYVQIGCALIGSLGASYNGVLLINFGISLFALVAIESNSQSLGRAYAFLLFCAILLDVAWFFLFAHDIWNISTNKYGPFFVFSVKLTLAMQIIGFTVKLSSSFLWIQIYRLGVSHIDTLASRDADYDLRNSFLSSPSTAIPRQTSDTNAVLGGAIFDPPYYSSLFEENQDNRDLNEVHNSAVSDNGSTSSIDAPQLKVSVHKSFEPIDEENGAAKPHQSV